MDYESTLKLKLFKDSQILERVMNCKLKVLEMEMKLNIKENRRVDMIYQNLSNNKIVFCEIQLNEADKKHYRQLKKIIESSKVNNFEIIWIASDFERGFIERLFKLSVRLNKNIRIRAVKISSELLNKTRLFKVNKLYALKEVDNFKFSKKDLVLFKDFKNRTSASTKITSFNDLTDSKHTNYKYLKEILTYMREFSSLESIHTYKDISNAFCQVGLGISDIFFSLNINEPRNLIYFSVNFNSNRYDVYEDFLEKKEVLDKKTNFMLNYQQNKIYFEVPFQFAKRNMIKFIAYSAVQVIEFIFKEIKKLK